MLLRESRAVSPAIHTAQVFNRNESVCDCLVVSVLRLANPPEASYNDGHLNATGTRT